MKQLFLIFLSCFLVSAYVQAQQSLKILDFYPGMSRDEVKVIYNKMKEVPVAQYVSLEPGQYRDQIKIDNEFGSISNKIDILYDDNAAVNSVTFQFRVTDILLEASDMDHIQLAEKLSKDLGIGGFEEVTIGTGKGLEFSDGNLKLSIDSYKNIRLQKSD